MQLIELDGRKQGPYVVAENCQDVLRATIKEIQSRLEKGEIRDNMSLITLNQNWD